MCQSFILWVSVLLWIFEYVFESTRLLLNWKGEGKKCIVNVIVSTLYGCVGETIRRRWNDKIFSTQYVYRINHQQSVKMSSSYVVSGFSLVLNHSLFDLNKNNWKKKKIQLDSLSAELFLHILHCLTATSHW